MAMQPQYALWWRLTERCASQSSDLGQISWYTVPGAGDLGSADHRSGEYYLRSHRIVIAGRFVGDGPLVRHEMLHAILGLPGHPAEDFQRRCGGVVACDGTCLSDGGVSPPADTTGPIVRPVDLEVSARVDSTRPSLARDSGWVAVTIAIHNPRPTPVRVHLTPLVPGYWASGTYGYGEGYCNSPGFNSPSYSFVEDSTLVLGAGETQRKMFDLQVWNVCIVVKPFFNDDTLPTIRIDPQP
jgi:hypothetical protein